VIVTVSPVVIVVVASCRSPPPPGVDTDPSSTVWPLPFSMRNHPAVPSATGVPDSGTPARAAVPLLADPNAVAASGIVTSSVTVSFADAGGLRARISIEPAPPLSVRSTTASAAALRLALGRRIAMSISGRGRVDGERPAPTSGGELGHVLVGQPQRTRLGPAPRAGHLERAGALLLGPDPLGVAQVPDHHPAHHLHHPGQRQLAAVDPVLDVGENTQDGVLGVADQGADLLIGGRDRGGAEPPVTHILWCRPRH